MSKELLVIDMQVVMVTRVVRVQDIVDLTSVKATLVQIPLCY
jgi:hypothetical protein